MSILHFPHVDQLQKPFFEDVYEEYYQVILRYFYKHTGNLHDAEDLASETFLYCYRTYDRYNVEKSSISTWLYLTAGSRLKNYYRDRKENLELSELENYLFVETVGMEQATYIEQLRHMLAEKMKQLPERQQKAVVMRFFQNKSTDEIAAALNVSPGNARVLLSRALDKLEKDLSIMKDDWSI